jgi:hypothetical protein
MTIQELRELLVSTDNFRPHENSKLITCANHSIESNWSTTKIRYDRLLTITISQHTDGVFYCDFISFGIELFASEKIENLDCEKFINILDVFLRHLKFWEDWKKIQYRNIKIQNIIL